MRTTLLLTLLLLSSQTENTFASQKVTADINSTTHNTTLAAPSETEIPDGAIIWEDFSGFTEGSEESPASEDINDPSSGLIPDNCTIMPGWRGKGVHQAGGTAYIGKSGYIMGNIETPRTDLSGNNGTYTISFKARSQSEEGGTAYVYAFIEGDQFTKGYQEITLTNEWTEFSMEFGEGAEDTYIRIMTYSGEWYLDDFKVTSEGLAPPTVLPAEDYDGVSATARWEPVDGASSYIVTLYYYDEVYGRYTLVSEQEVTETSCRLTDLDPEKDYAFTVKTVKNGNTSPESDKVEIKIDITAPEVQPCTDFADTSFTANWSKVEGATAYLLTVFRYEPYSTGVGKYEVPVVENLEVTETSYEVTDIDVNTYTYFYRVAALKGQARTEESGNMAAVPEMETPVADEATNVTENSFTANWQPVPYGHLYMTTVFKQHTAAENETYSLVNTDFSDVVSENKIDDPEMVLRPYYFPAAEGWYINTAAYANGAIGIDNSFGELVGTSYLISPKMDFSAGGGKVKVKMKWMGIKVSYAWIAFATVSDEGELTFPTDNSYPVPTTLTENELVIEGGQKDCYLIIATPFLGAIMFDELSISMDLAEGESITHPLLSARTEGETSYNFTDIQAEKDDLFFYNVAAAYYADGMSPVTSARSEMIEVKLKNATEQTEAMTGASAYASGNTIYVCNPEGAAVEVFGVNGQLVAADRSGQQNVQFGIEAKGIYIVKAGDKTFKIVK